MYHKAGVLLDLGGCQLADLKDVEVGIPLLISGSALKPSFVPYVGCSSIVKD